ncbi:MAG: helicase [Oligoflexia bacterium]|nr:helicase [Oligoflexia bacterium]
MSPLPTKSKPPDTRFTLPAARSFRAAIDDAGGVEVFAVGRLDAEGRVAEVEIHCRGNTTAVPALLRAPRPGEVVIHNHPSGVLQASQADLHLAGLYGEDGVGMVITDNAVETALWVVEPSLRQRRDVDLDQVRAFFLHALPKVIPGWESRAGQVDMAIAVARALNDGRKERPVVAALEAGTGTGKSLAYLVPAALWAKANDSRIVIATYTINLQGQLAHSDLPMLARGGLDVRAAVLSGRGNYLCRRRLSDALAELDSSSEPGAEPDPHAATIRQAAAWAEHARRGARADLGFPMPEDVWDRIRSDHDQTLRARCPHFARCLYYEARRDAARAQVVVVNQHLLLADLVLKIQTGGDGILPRFDRAIIDEAHHLEDAATGLFSEKLTALAIRRAVAPLLSAKRRKGALQRAVDHYAEALDATAADRLRGRCHDAQAALELLGDDMKAGFESLAIDLFCGEDQSLRVTPDLRGTDRWRLHLAPAIDDAAQRLDDAASRLARIEQSLDELPEDRVLAHPQPLLDLRRARRRLLDKAAVASAMQAEDPDRVRWLAPVQARRGPKTATLATAPIDVGPTLRQRVFESLETTILTSATMSVYGRFDHILGRLGLEGSLEASEQALQDIEIRQATLPSPFHYEEQALLALPRDLPPPDDPRFGAWAGRFVAQAARASGGGVFVLCTSHALVATLHQAVRKDLGDSLPLLRQGELSRLRLLDRFRSLHNAVLFGTDSFWEGVSVPGAALRLVIIPRLPFRVPTEPVQQARHERLQAAGQDPFRAWSLPHAVLRLRQGFGRLIRTRSDRGAVAILDRRIHERWYGKVFLGSLPPAARATGPARAVLDRLRAFYAQSPGSADTLPARTSPPDSVEKP